MPRTAEQLRYAPTHEWVATDGDLATVGISAFAIAELTDLVFMALPQAGREIKAGEEFGEVESVKAVSPLYSPISGTIAEVNSDLVDRLETLADDPYENGWIIRIRMSDPSEVQKLMDHAAYREQCGEAG